jgi:TetR/AcrR family transcriptional regulator, transcriptional repressor for nem operon
MESSGFGDTHIKVSREQVAEHRTRILATAARLFRLRGFDEVTVAEVMKEAGLTHGAFYGYVPSKEALIAEAVRQALPRAPDEAKPRRPAADYADGYLSARHRGNRATSCLFSSLGTEAARGSADLRHRMTEEINMPFIQCDLEAGLSDSEKRDLVKKMTEVTHKAIGSAYGHINVVLRDLDEAGEADLGLISGRGSAGGARVKVA